MAGKIVQTTDFVGKYAITQNTFNESDLQSFIDKYEILYLYDLLGVTLGNALYANIAPSTFLPPVTAIYATLFNPIYSDENTICSNQIRSNGIKEMLIGFIYWEYTKQQAVNNTITGNVIQQNEVSNGADWNTSEIYNIYNVAVKSYNAIQSYIRKNSTVYPDFNGLYKGLNHWAV